MPSWKRHDEFISEVTDEMAESLLETVKEDAFSSDLEAFREVRRQFGTPGSGFLGYADKPLGIVHYDSFRGRHDIRRKAQRGCSQIG